MKQIVALTIGLKITLFLILFLSASLLPYSKTMYEGNFLFPPNQKHSVFSSIQGWDAQHYLFLAEKGYKEGNLSNKFFPLYPLLISVVTVVTHNSVIAGLLVSNVFSFLAIFYLFRFLKERWNEKVALLGCAIFLLFPTAFYLSLIYTESVFLFLIFGFFYYLYKRKYFIAAFFSLFIPLTRPVGLFIIIPFTLFFLTDAKREKKRIILPSFGEPVHVTVYPQIFSLLFPFLGLCLYFGFMYLTTGDAFSGFTTEQNFIGGYRIENLFSPTTFFKTLFTSNLSVHSFTTSLIDRLFFLFFLLHLPFVRWKLDKVLFTYSLTVGLVPLFGSFMGYTRYLLPAFSMYVVLALLFSKEKYGFLLGPFLVLSYGLQTFFIVLYGLNYWVS